MRIHRTHVALIMGLLTCVAQGATQPRAPIALEGTVSSAAEGKMEGVLIKARREELPFTVTVVSDSRGHYQFPADRLHAGKYQLSIRATGYDLENPVEIKIVAAAPARLDLKLASVGVLPSQLTNAEWLLSLERAGAPKQQLAKLDCVACHSLERVFTSRHTVEEWVFTLGRMKTYGAGGQKLPYEPPATPVDEDLARFLSTVNLNGREKSPFEYKTFPRPKGAETKVVITEYDVPIAGFQPHEVLVDPEGKIWTTNFVGPDLLKLDPESVQFTAYKMPYIKPDYPHGQNCFEMDTAGNLWWVGLKQAGIFKFDRTTEKFTTWKLPTGDMKTSHAGCLILSPDGTAWAQEQALPQIQRLHPDTGEFTLYQPFPANAKIVPAKRKAPQVVGYLGGSGLGGGYQELDEDNRTLHHTLYGSAMDSKGTFYIADIGAGYIVRIDPETKAVTLFQTPTPNSGPRKMQMDSQDRLWFAEYQAGKVGMLDPKTAAFKEWPLETPYSGPYDVDIDQRGDAWTGGMHTDYLYRLIPRTGKVIKYLLPTVNVNMRNMGGLDKRSSGGTIWIGENLQGKVARVEVTN